MKHSTISSNVPIDQKNLPTEIPAQLSKAHVSRERGRNAQKRQSKGSRQRRRTRGHLQIKEARFEGTWGKAILTGIKIPAGWKLYLTFFAICVALLVITMVVCLKAISLSALLPAFTNTADGQ
jgi:hypothetical protein